MDYLGNTYFNRKNQVVKAERRILKELGFCVHVKHPHKIIINYLRILECENNREFTQLSWNYMNDSLRTDVFVRFPPETIACACIFLSARKLEICLPCKPHWFTVFDATIEDLEKISLTVLELYLRPQAVLEELLKKATDLRKEMEEKKKKVSGEVTQGTPNTSPKPAQDSRPGSRVSSPGKTSPSCVGDDTKRKASKTDAEKKVTKDRNTKSNGRSRSPRTRHGNGSKGRSPSRSPSRSRSKSRSRSRSRSSSPSSHDIPSDSFSSDESPDKRKRQSAKTHKERGRSLKNREHHRSRDHRLAKRPSSKGTVPNSYASNRERTYDRKRAPRVRSRSPISRSRSRSVSPGRDRSKRRYTKYPDRERSKTAEYYRNGVERRDREEGGRDHSRRYR